MTTTTSLQEFCLPDLGEGLTEAELVTWLVAEGDEIEIDQPIAEVETAKSMVELPSPFAGRVVELIGAAGSTLEVGAPILRVAAPGVGAESADAPVAQPPAPASSPAPAAAAPVAVAASAEVPEEPDAADAKSGNVLIGYGTSASSKTRKRASRFPRTARTSELTSAPRGPIAVRSPLVRRLARELGVDLHVVTPTAPDGCVTRADVQRAASDARPARPTTGASGLPAPDAPLQEVSRERMSMLRRAASAKFARSRAEIPEATVWVDVDLSELWRLRPSMAASGGKPPSLTTLLARYVLIALGEYPLLAGRVEGDEIVQYDGVNLGVAADTARGLMVPMIARAERLSLADLDVALREVAVAAREGTLPPAQLQGSTFTLNNYGAFGVDGSAAIINHPEVAILGIGRALERAWVVDGQIVPRRIAQLSLVFDHRICDGGYAAGFLRRVVDLLENPLAAYGRV
ncbi:2-oxo acid dehydrogenase subunit E2 [Micrococcales bacterium 31B]|nr:2-oxo acid dehydrogenase subunit E2 [Micrococcales bacterium 31B]